LESCRNRAIGTDPVSTSRFNQEFAMPVTHINRKRHTYYLHAGVTKTGKPRYWFSKSTEGDLVDTMPGGYEVYENPDAQVFLRKIVPQLVTTAEVAVVADGLKRFAPGQDCLVDVQGKQIVVYHAEQITLDLERFGVISLPDFARTYLKVMRFTLVDEKDRAFRAERWCFRGSIDRWIDLRISRDEGKLSALVKRFCPHIGQESFYDLM
jgi:hypothetical protein